LRSRAPALAERLLPLLLVGISLAAYYNSFEGVFLFDDEAGIINKPQIRQLWPPWGAMAQSLRPVLEVTLALNYAVGGVNPWGYHAVNLAVHILAGLLLFGIVRRMLESDHLRARYGAASRWLALAVAGIWLVHPLQTESVTYIIQRAESLMGLFFLLTLYCGIRACQSPHPRGWGVAAVLACALGMGSKQVMVSAPILMWLYDRVFISRTFSETFRRRWWLYAGLAATWLVLGAALVASRAMEHASMVAGLNPWSYAVTQSEVIVHYLRLSVWPHPLVLDYTWRLPETLSSTLHWVGIVAALVGGTGVALWRLPWVGFWGAWFFLILAPTSSILPIADLAFEHRMYLSLAAVVVLVVIGVHEALGHALRRLKAPSGLRRGLEAGLMVMVVAVLGFTTVRRNADYRSDLAIWADTVAKRPDNPRAHNNLGIAMSKQARTGEALTHFAEAVRLKPNYADAQMNLAFALVTQGRNKEAIAHYSAAIRLTPESSRAHHNLGVALYREGLTAQAIAEYSEALRLKPDLPEAHHNLGLALAKQDRIDEAIAQFGEAVRLKPDNARAHNNLGTLLYRQGRVKEASAHYAEAVRLEPDSADALNNLRAAEGSVVQTLNRP